MKKRGESKRWSDNPHYIAPLVGGEENHVAAPRSDKEEKKRAEIGGAPQKEGTPEGKQKRNMSIVILNKGFGRSRSMFPTDKKRKGPTEREGRGGFSSSGFRKREGDENGKKQVLTHERKTGRKEAFTAPQKKTTEGERNRLVFFEVGQKKRKRPRTWIGRKEKPRGKRRGGGRA